jgi:transposase InsO family protein
VTYYVLFFMRVKTREVQIAGATPNPNEAWMKQIARNITMADVGFLKPGDVLIHDRDGKYCPAFDGLLDDVGVTPRPLPPRSPNLNPHAERWVGSAKFEVFNHLILFGERSLFHALREYQAHFLHERPHQGVGNVVLFPGNETANDNGRVVRKERLGGLLSYYHRVAS